MSALDRVSRAAYRLKAAEPRPPFDNIDLDSTICETRLAKELRAPHHGSGARGYHPLLAVRNRNELMV